MILSISIFIIIMILSGAYDGYLYQFLPSDKIHFFAFGRKFHRGHLIAWFIRAGVAVLAFYNPDLLIWLKNSVAAGLITPLLITESLVFSCNVIHKTQRFYFDHHSGIDGNPYVRIALFMLGFLIFWL